MTTRETKNFVWDISPSCILGRGQMGTVYKGSCKSTGEKVAIKSLNRGVPKEYQHRELAQLSTIRHENIVKLIAVEEEQIEGKTVMILELCTGGSLLSYLQEPENCYGLEDSEVLLVLEHLEAGIKYLRENDILHRDLKPGNIMRHIGEDGRSVYKLSDFDAARNLPEGEEFESIFGTPAYLCPSLYEQQFMMSSASGGGDGPTRKFTASTDLWSIGVTLYHVCTGRLPFRPYEGAENFKTMHYIITKKPPGSISGVQSKMGGPIEWSCSLPDDCLLSAGLQKLITPLLAALLESDTRRRCSYADFFRWAEGLGRRRRVYLFYVNEVKLLHLYLDRERRDADKDNLSDLQSQITEQTQIPPANQLIFYKEALLVDEESTSFAKTSPECPLILCHKEENNVEVHWRLPDVRFLAFPNQLNYYEDAKISKHNVTVGYVYRRQLEKMNRSIALLSSTASSINTVVVSQLLAISKEVLQIKSLITALDHQFKMMESFHRACRSFIPLIPKHRKNSNDNSNPTNSTAAITQIVNSMGEAFVQQRIAFWSFRTRFQELTPAVNQLHAHRVERKGARSLVCEWEARTENIPETGPVMTTATNVLHKLQNSYENLNQSHEPYAHSPGFPPHAASRRQSSHETQLFHLTERLLMQDKCKSLLSLLKKQYNDVFLVVVKHFSDWYKTAQVALLQPEILVKDLVNLRRTLAECEGQLNESVEAFNGQLAKFTDGLRKACAETELEIAMKEKKRIEIKSVSKEKLDQLNEELKELIVSQQELKSLFSLELEAENR